MATVPAYTKIWLLRYGVAAFGVASRNAFAHNMIPGPSTRYLYIEIPRRRGRRCRLQVCSSCAAARHSNFHWNAHVRPDGQSFVEWRPSDPPSIFTEYALPTDRGLTCGDGQLVDCLRTRSGPRPPCGPTPRFPAHEWYHITPLCRAPPPPVLFVN